MRGENAPVHPLKPGFDPTDPALPAEFRGCCLGSEQQFLLPGYRDAGRSLSHMPCPCHGSWAPSPGSAVPLCPRTSRGCSRWPGPRRRSRSGSRRSRRICGCWAATWGAGQPLERPSGPGALQEGREEHQPQPGTALQSGSHRSPTERDFIGNAASHCSQGGSSKAGPTTGNHSTGELRRKEREPRALRRENHH